MTELLLDQRSVDINFTDEDGKKYFSIIKVMNSS